MRTWILTIIAVGMTIGFLLALGMVTLLQSVLDGDDFKLSVAFTAFVGILAASLIWYVVRYTR